VYAVRQGLPGASSVSSLVATRRISSGEDFIPISEENVNGEDDLYMMNLNNSLNSNNSNTSLTSNTASSSSSASSSSQLGSNARHDTTNVISLNLPTPLGATSPTKRAQPSLGSTTQNAANTNTATTNTNRQTLRGSVEWQRPKLQLNVGSNQGSSGSNAGAKPWPQINAEELYVFTFLYLYLRYCFCFCIISLRCFLRLHMVSSPPLRDHYSSICAVHVCELTCRERVKQNFANVDKYQSYAVTGETFVSKGIEIGPSGVRVTEVRLLLGFVSVYVSLLFLVLCLFFRDEWVFFYYYLFIYYYYFIRSVCFPFCVRNIIPTRSARR
jgi:hypothetical protein